MSRVGKKPIPLTAGVKVSIENEQVVVKGPKGTLTTPIAPGIQVEVKDNTIHVLRDSDDRQLRAKHGLMRSLINNSVLGVTQGFTKEMDFVGIGYRAELRKNRLLFNIGYSHPIEFELPEGIQAKVEKLNKPNITNYQGTITLTGNDKYLLGQTAANIRYLRPPDPYKGKGLRYATERIKLKEGKRGA